jgi:hypothetical protein
MTIVVAIVLSMIAALITSYVMKARKKNNDK